MRELSLNEMKLVSGSGHAIDTLNATIEGGTAGAGAFGGAALAAGRGAVTGLRFGVLGALFGGLVGLSAGIWDWYDSYQNQDGSNYADGTSYN
ncbi:MAG: hypothetical protein Q4B17_08840 [Lautropia sp.]|nr:hypothetical protein [Lautropia sp.]